jgi:hypothetical protein
MRCEHRVIIYSESTLCRHNGMLLSTLLPLSYMCACCQCTGAICWATCAHDDCHSRLFSHAVLSSLCLQGFSLAVKLGLTKQHVDSLVGIHPTSAEEVLGLKGPDRVVGPSE